MLGSFRNIDKHGVSHKELQVFYNSYRLAVLMWNCFYIQCLGFCFKRFSHCLLPFIADTSRAALTWLSNGHFTIHCSHCPLCRTSLHCRGRLSQSPLLVGIVWHKLSSPARVATQPVDHQPSLYFYWEVGAGLKFAPAILIKSASGRK